MPVLPLKCIATFNCPQYQKTASYFKTKFVYIQQAELGYLILILLCHQCSRILIHTHTKVTLLGKILYLAILFSLSLFSDIL